MQVLAPPDVIDEQVYTRFKVSGNNWYNFVHVNIEEYDGNDPVFQEAATKGVEKFQVGEYTRTDPEKDRVGFGRLIIVEDEEGNRAGFRSDLILANAGLHKEAAKLKKILDKQ